MSYIERRSIIQRIEKVRGSSVICFLTSLRQNTAGMIAEDAVRVFFDHLLLLPSRPVDKLDLFLVSNGGQGTVPWRLVALFREFAAHFSVLLPYRAYSAASLIALGADEIVMHPFAELGPIDPTVSNEYNPTDPNTGQVKGISVEDVTAYVNFVKETVGITHEDELVQALIALTQQVNPLALGNVERFLAQSRMIARKILKTHIARKEEHVIDEIVENMASKLYFHGHPINRREAKADLKLNVNLDLTPELETAIWDLYRDFETEFENLVPFHPPGDLAAMPTPPAPAPTAGGPAPAAPPKEKEYELLHAIVESDRLTSRLRTKRRFAAVTVMTPRGPQPGFQEDVLSQGWSHSSAQPAATASQPSATDVPDAPAGEPHAQG